VDQEFLPIFVDEGLDVLAVWEATCIDLEKDPTPALVEALFRAAHNLKGSSRSVGLVEFGHVVHRIEDVINRLRDNSLRCDANLVGFFLECQAFLRNWLQAIREQPDHLPDSTRILQQCASYVEAGVHPQPEQASSKEVATPPVHPQNGTKSDPPANPTRSERTAARADETIRISAAKLDHLLQLIGELSIHQAIISHALAGGHLQQSASLNSIHLSAKITREAQSHALGLRMQPLKGLFQRLERAARDVARNEKKSLDIQILGADVELDKSVIEHMTDPLVHLIRNAVDHGVEDSEARAKAGKAATACVTLRAVQDSGGVEISVQDDGRGLNPTKILEKARERGLIAADLTPPVESIYQMIFLPGFSTAEKVTDVSGRGVGMDVVRRTVDGLGGAIRIASEVGRGTTITITMPTSLSIIDALVVEIGKVTYAAPLGGLDEIIDLRSFPVVSSLHGRETVCLRGKILPYAPLQRFLTSRLHGDAQQETPRTALVARLEGKVVVLGVDRVIRQQQVVVRPLSKHLAKVPGFSGGTILPDGEPGLIIDIAAAIRHTVHPDVERAA
jgi:two-component system chemotaxis sensor kinase CheA